jgi:hypothetical protein
MLSTSSLTAERFAGSVAGVVKNEPAMLNLARILRPSEGSTPVKRTAVLMAGLLARVFQ